LEPLQRVQNAAARLVFQLNSREHITPSLLQLHWLPVRWRVQLSCVPLCTVCIMTELQRTSCNLWMVERRDLVFALKTHKLLCSTSSHKSWCTCIFIRRTSRLEQLIRGHPCWTTHCAFQEHS